MPIIEAGTVEEYDVLLKALRFKNETNYRVDRYLNKYCLLTANLIQEIEQLKKGLQEHGSFEAFVAAKEAEVAAGPSDRVR